MATKRILTQLAIDKAKPRPGRRYDLPDGPGGVPGLALRVGEHGAKTFSLRYRIGGQMKRITLGKHPVMTLADARTAARNALAQVEQGIDPAATRKDAEREPDRDTVAAVAAEYSKRHLRKNTRRWHDAEMMLKRDVLPVWGERMIQSITRRDVLDAVDGVVDRGSPVSANRVLSHIKMLLGWALQRGIVETNVAAGIKPPHREKPRERTLSETEIRLLWQAWNRMGYPFGQLGQLLLLSGQRRGEIAGLRWDDLDLDRGVLHLAGAATKSEREHVLPLSAAAVEILHGLPRIGDTSLVFPSSRLHSSSPVSGFSKALSTARRLSGVQGWTWHDLRRSCASHMARLGTSPHVVERILNHSSRSTLGTIARVYNTHSYRVEMDEALEAWAREVRRVVHGAEVVELPRRAAAP